MLYPLKFIPIFKGKIWGGNKISKILFKDAPEHCGESWEVACVNNDISEVENGFLSENQLDELIEIYMGDLVGEKIYDEFGLNFPLLIKFIDAQDNLSVQVHPDDKLSYQRYKTLGKTELWYVIDADEGSGLYVGFKDGVTQQAYSDAVAKGTVDALLKFYPVKSGDAFWIPAGTVHAIGKGVLLAEIQQSSDVTYRIFDWNRVGIDGKPRELHINEAMEAIHFDEKIVYAVNYERAKNKTVSLIRSKQFNINVLNFDTPLEKIYAKLDSFVIYICLEGHVHLHYDDEETMIEKGEVILIPATITEMKLFPHHNAKLLEIYM